MNTRARENGSALIVTLMVLLALTVMGTATVYFAGQHNELAVSARAREQTLYFSEAGVNWGVDWMQDNDLVVAAAGTNSPVALTDNLGNPVQYVGAGGTVVAAVANVQVSTSVDSHGRTVQCGLVGFSEGLGSPRLRVDSVAAGSIASGRSIEAHILLPPGPYCPQGEFLQGGYKGGGV